MRKIRVAMFFSSDPAFAGGVQEHVLGLSKVLIKRGYSVGIFGPEKNRMPYVNYQSVGKVIYVPSPNGNWGNILVGNRDSDNFISKINRDFDILHIHEPYLPFLAWKVIKEVKICKLATFHTAWEDESVLNFINPVLPAFRDFFSENIGGAIFVSDIARRRWESICGRNVIQRVISNGVDLSLFKPKLKRDSSKKIKLLFVGRLVRRKGLHYLLRAIRRLVKKRQDFGLTVLGDGRQAKKLKAYVKKNSLEKFVVFKGEILGEARVKYFAEADIFCAPYVDEAFGMTILEAMACGCAVVGFKIAAFSESLREYPGLEYLVPQQNVNKLTRALEKIIEDYELRIKLRAWGIEEAKKYSWEKVVGQTERIYVDLIGKRKRRRCG